MKNLFCAIYRLSKINKPFNYLSVTDFKVKLIKLIKTEKFKTKFNPIIVALV